MRAYPITGQGVRLEGLCEQAADRTRAITIRTGSGCEGIERLEARLAGLAFSPHRHDTYAVGITLSGVQTFRYRGERRICLPGQCHILHPDELHDGAPATSDGFAYAMLYLDPSLIQQALAGAPLPFAPNPVIDLTPEQRDSLVSAWDMTTEMDDTAGVEIATAVADLLLAVSRSGGGTPRKLNHQALQRARELIDSEARTRRSLGELEAASGLDRWTLARQFRAAFGTSPSRFRTMRQLDQVRRLVKLGRGLAEAALEAGFADQSHMSRQFKRAYGLTPARWAAALA